MNCLNILFSESEDYVLYEHLEVKNFLFKYVGNNNWEFITDKQEDAFKLCAFLFPVIGGKLDKVFIVKAFTIKHHENKSFKLILETEIYVEYYKKREGICKR